MALINDDFTRADGTDIGANWSAHASNAQIVGNEVRPTALDTRTFESYRPVTVGADQFAKVKAITLAAAGAANGVGSIIRAATPPTQTYYAFEGYTVFGTTTEIAHYVAGARTVIASEAATTWVANDVIIGLARGSVIHLFRNGSPLLNVTDATIASGQPGIFCYAGAGGAVSQSELDDFYAGDLPISFVAAGTEGDAASGNVSPGLPSGIRAGDILIAVCHSSDQVSHSMGSEWTQIVQGNGGGTTSRLSVWWHRYNGAQNPSTTITHTAGAGISAGIAAFRGCKRSGSPVNVNSAIAGGTDASMEHSTVTPTMDFCLLLVINGSADDNTRTLLAGYTNIFEDATAATQNAFIGTAGTPDESCSMFMRDAMAVATGTVTVTQSAADPWAAVLVALEPEMRSVPPVNPILQSLKRGAFH